MKPPLPVSASNDNAAAAEAMLRRCGDLPDEAIDLAEAALALALLDGEHVDAAPYRRHLDTLAADLVAAAGAADATLADRAHLLQAVILGRHGYGGDTETYDDLQNANLIRVIDRRRGLPVALGVLFMHAARTAGWTVHGLNFPAHFLLRLDRGAERAVIDPFHGGKLREAAELRAMLKQVAGDGVELGPAHYSPVGNRAVLLRLHNNVKTRLLRLNRVAEAARAAQAMLWLAPRDAGLWRETGLIEAHVGNLKRGIEALETALGLGLPDGQRHETELAIKRLKGRLN